MVRSVTVDACGQSLLDGILEHPGEDDRRLVYADWLDDSGQSERAEFIRYSIRVPQCSHLALTARDPFPLLGLTPGEPQWVGVPGGAGQWRTWMWGETDSLGLVVSDMGRGLDYRVGRGFISGVLCTQAAWLKYGSAIVRLHPVVRVVLSDKRPSRAIPAEGYWFRYASQLNERPDDLDPRIFDRLSGGKLFTDPDPRRYYREPQDPIADLSQACILTSKDNPPLPPI